MGWIPFEVDQSDDGHELDDLITELYRQMFIVAYSRMNNKADALDVVQESWLKILQKIETLKDKDKLFQWAKTIVINTAHNALRKRRYLSIVPVNVELFGTNGSEAEDEWEARWWQEAITRCLKQLDDETRKILTYKYFYGCKDKQIAEMVALPVGTVKARIHRAKERLRRMLHSEEADGQEHP